MIARSTVRSLRLICYAFAFTSLSACERLPSIFQFGANDEKASEVIQTQETQHQNPQTAMLLPDFTKLVEEQGPTVVNIQAIKGRPSSDYDLGESETNEDPFLEFFNKKHGNQPQPQISQAYGSGFIVSKDGYILTNAHVVSDATEIKIVLTDKQQYAAKLIGLDKRTDIALLKVDAQNLPSVIIGKPERLKVGEWVAAIGAPFGFDNSVTAGIVSAKGRNLRDETYVPFIQTDVAINPGNSGGPLFNLHGEVIGINSQIYSQSGGFMGISFAIPIDLAMQVANQLKEKGHVTRGLLGIQIQEVTPDLAASFGLDKARGALIVGVTPNSPAEKAGLLVGDVILKANDKDINNSRELPFITGSMQPNEQVNLSIWRNKTALVLTATLSEMSADTPAQGQLSPDPTVFQLSKIGLTVSELSPEEKQQLNIQCGLKVEQVEGLSKSAGLFAGDILLKLNQTTIKDIKVFERGLNAEQGPIVLLVLRNNQALFLPLKLN
jgi:serine protease Do